MKERMVSKIIELENEWGRTRVPDPTHLAMSMMDYLILKEEVAKVEGVEIEESAMTPLKSYEGLIVLISEDPYFNGPILLTTD